MVRMADFVKHPLIKEKAIQSRLYQEILAARVLDKGSSLVVAPTALGKTIVGVLVAADLLQKNKGKILFLAPTKPLAVQHQKSFQKLMKLPAGEIALLTGTVAPKERKKIFRDATVVAATPQTIENDIITGNVSLKDVLLCVFDEAHRSVGSYSYVFIAQQYMRQAEKPLVLALTASPGWEEEKIQTVCKNLFIENIEIKTQADSDVKPYTHEISVEWRRVELPAEFMEIKNLLEQFQKEQLEALKKFGLVKTTNLRYYNKRRLLEMMASIRKRMHRAKTQPSLYAAISKAAALLKVNHAALMLETQGIPAALNYFEKMEKTAQQPGSAKALKTILNNESMARAIALTRQLNEKKVVHPKLNELIDVLEKQFKGNENSRVLVFNHYRSSVKNLVKYLKKVKGVKAKRFIGQAMKESDRGMSQKEQIETIKEFEKGKYNTLVASSVAEEGLDIPSVDLVVFFEPIPSEIRAIQRRGRTGRLAEGKAVILMATGTRDEAFYWSAVGKERKMQKTLRAMQKGFTPKKLEQQKTLVEFNEKLKDMVLIYADTAEQPSTVIRYLKDKECMLKVKRLDVGDYILSNDVGVERKTVEDFLNSMLDGRLFHQLINLTENFKKPLMLVEGSMEDLFTLRNVHRNAIIGCLTSIALNYRIPILFTKDAEETADYLYVTAKREQLGKEKDVRLRTGRKGLTTAELQRYIVESLPLVGPNMAKALLKKFGSVKGIFTANREELRNVENLGKKKASRIRRVIDGKYKEA